MGGVNVKKGTFSMSILKYCDDVSCGIEVRYKPQLFDH